MRVIVLVAVVVASGCSDPVLRQMRDDPTWCPERWEQIEATFARIMCEPTLCTGEGPRTEKECIEDIHQSPLRFPPGTCFDGCAARRCMEAGLTCDDTLWTSCAQMVVECDDA